MNTIDKIYIINLKERKDRWTKCLEQLDKYNITNYQRFDAIKPNFNKINPIQYSKNNFKLDKKYIIGAFGCKLSHLKIIMEAKQKKYKRILILEDDFMLTNNFLEKFSQIINNIKSHKINVNMLYLGFSIVRKNPYEDTGIDNLKKLIKGHTTHAYILSESFYDIVIDKIRQCYCEIDICYVKMQQKYENIYGIFPCLITQRESYSDILNRNVNYKKFIELDNK